MNTKASKNTFTVVKILHSAISNIESKRTVGPGNCTLNKNTPETEIDY